MGYEKDRTETITVRITEKRKRRDKAFAKKHGMTLTELVEKGIDTYISQRDKNGDFLL